MDTGGKKQKQKSHYADGLYGMADNRVICRYNLSNCLIPKCWFWKKQIHFCEKAHEGFPCSDGAHPCGSLFGEK